MRVKEPIKDEFRFSFSSDKANVGGLSLCNTIIGWGDVATVAPPRVIDSAPSLIFLGRGEPEPAIVFLHRERVVQYK